MTKSNSALTSIDLRRSFDDARLTGVYVFVLCSIPDGLWRAGDSRIVARTTPVIAGLIEAVLTTPLP